MTARLLIGALALACCAFAAPTFAQGNICLQRSQIRGWDATDREHLVVTDATRHKFTVTVLGPCEGLQFTEGLRIDHMGPSSCLEKNDSLSFRGPGGIRQSCPISDIQPN